MKKLIIPIIVMVLLVYPLSVQATNTHSLDFELTDSEYAWAADSAELSITGDFTLEFWLNLEQTAGNAASIFYLVSKETILDDNLSWWTYIHSNNDQLHIGISEDGTVGDLTIARSTSTLVATATWVHIAIKVDISIPSVSYWFDGVEEAANMDAAAAQAMADTTSKFSLGCNFDGGGAPANFLDGKLDDVRVWDDLRTEAEIQDNDDLELNGNEDNLVAYYLLNNNAEDKGTITDPAGSNADDLTLVSSDSGPTYSTSVPFEDASPPAGGEDEFPVMQMQ